VRPIWTFASCADTELVVVFAGTVPDGPWIPSNIASEAPGPEPAVTTVSGTTPAGVVNVAIAFNEYALTIMSFAEAFVVAGEVCVVLFALPPLIPSSGLVVSTPMYAASQAAAVADAPNVHV
jgi:hypothetical protein